MTKILPFLNDPGVIREWIDNEDGTITVTEKQDCGSILELNKAMASHNDGYTPSREMRRVASIPLNIIQKWKDEEGWDALNPLYADKLALKLDDPDWQYLRTAPGVIGKRRGMI